MAVEGGFRVKGKFRGRARLFAAGAATATAAFLAATHGSPSTGFDSGIASSPAGNVTTSAVLMSDTTHAVDAGRGPTLQQYLDSAARNRRVGELVSSWGGQIVKDYRRDHRGPMGTLSAYCNPGAPAFPGAQDCNIGTTTLLPNGQIFDVGVDAVLGPQKGEVRILMANVSDPSKGYAFFSHTDPTHWDVTEGRTEAASSNALFNPPSTVKAAQQADGKAESLLMRERV